MKVVALVSGGKDSCYAMMECVRHGHEIVALANLYPPSTCGDELDSFMFQTVGHQIIEYIGQAMELPLYREPLHGKSVEVSLNYVPGQDNDEILDLEKLLTKVLEAHPDIQGVCSGAILSNYQRSRVEYVCGKLKLQSFSYLWQRHQPELLKEIIDNNVTAVLVKIASQGLQKKHLTQTLKDLHPFLMVLQETSGLNVCGEGGEYETLTLDCPLFKSRIQVDTWEYYGEVDRTIAPVIHVTPKDIQLVKKTDEEYTQGYVQMFTKPDMNRKSYPLAYTPPTIPVTYIFANTSKTSADTGDNDDDDSKSKSKSSNSSNSNNHDDDDDVKFVSSSSSSTLTKLSSPHANLTDLLVSILPPPPTSSSNDTTTTTTTSTKLYVNLGINDMGAFGSINTEYVTQMPMYGPPARACVQIYPIVYNNNTYDQAADVVYCTTNTIDTCYLHVQSVSRWAPANIGPYAQAWKVGDTILFAGQIGMIPEYMNFPADALQEVKLSIKNAIQGLYGYNGSKLCISSLAMYTSAQSFTTLDIVKSIYKNDTSIANVAADTEPTASLVDVYKKAISKLPLLTMEIIEEYAKAHKRVMNDDNDEQDEEEVSVYDIYPNKPTLSSTYFPVITLDLDASETFIPCHAPMSVPIVPVLPRQAHTEAQIIGINDGCDTTVRRMYWCYQTENKNIVVVVGGMMSEYKTIDLTAHVYTTPSSTNTTVDAHEVLEAVDAAVQYVAVEQGFAYTRDAKETKQGIYKPTHCTLTNTTYDKVIATNIIRARLMYTHTLDTTPLVTAIMQNASTKASPLASASLTGVYTMLANDSVAKHIELPRYKTYLGERNETKTYIDSITQIQEQINSMECVLTYQVALSTNVTDIIDYE